MFRALLSLCLSVVVWAEPPQEKAAAPAPSSAPPRGEASIIKRQAALEKQRASVRKQVTNWIPIGDPQPGESFIIPWPKVATGPVTNIALRTLIDSIPCDPIPEASLDHIVNDAAERQKVSPKLVRAMILQESGGRPCAVSYAGAQGLMQLMPEVQRDLNVENPFDPMESVEAGVKLLRNLLDRYAGNVPKALAAYNAGPGAVDRAGGIPPIPQTTNYVAKIVKRIE